MFELMTVGVYDFDVESFLRRLRGAGVRVLLDVRQRRGVRGPQYAWANSLRLQASLADAGIAYEHHRELAPTTELRELQYAEDTRRGVGKRSRHELSADYIHRYTTEILDRADLTPILTTLRTTGPAALLCVEQTPEACHRSLIANRLAHNPTIHLTHLLPTTSSPGTRTAPLPHHSPQTPALCRHHSTPRSRHD